MTLKTCTFATLVVVALSVTATNVGAQNLVNRSRLDLRLGTRFTSRTSTSPGGVKTTQAGGILASIGFTHWLLEGLALTSTASFLGTRVETSPGGGGSWKTDRAFSLPILLGLKNYIPIATETSRWRPWASAEAGPIIGIELTSVKGRYGARSRDAFGARFAFGARGGAGLDVRLGELMTVSGSAGYLLIPGFLDSGGNQNNHQGLDVGITLSFLLQQKGTAGATAQEGNH